MLGLDAELSHYEENLAQRLQGIEFDNLQTTLRDAVTTTRWLGLHYLWVDVVCLIQDDGLDKEKEIGNIASGVDTGFLHHKPMKPKPVQILIRLPGNKIGNLKVYVKSLSYIDINVLLYHRGWALQELLLFPRYSFSAKNEARTACPLRASSLRVEIPCFRVTHSISGARS